VLVDSSVWIAYMRGDATQEVLLLSATMEAGRAPWMAPPILQEVLQGADRPERLARWERMLGALPMLESADQRATAIHAAGLYARCRWAGYTPRSSTDCLIATYAVEHRLPLLHADRDFTLIAGIEPRLRLLGAAARPVRGA